jgi:uncharacterized paraquat-inducible protein A
MAWEEEEIWEEDDAESDDSPIDDDEETVPCPYCRRAVLEDAERCPYCEQYISQEDAPPTGKSWWIIVAAALCLFGTAWWIFSI